MSIEQKLLVGLRSYTSLRVLTQILSWLGTVYVVRRLDSHAFGEYGVALVVFNYVSMVYDGSFVEALVQKPPEGPDAWRAVFTLLVGVGFGLAALVVALAKPVALLVGDLSVAPLIAAVAFALAMTSLCVLPHARLARDMAFRRLAGVGAVQAVCVTATTVSLAYLGKGAWALAAGLMAGTAVRCLMLNAVAPGLMRMTTRLSPALQYLRFGGVLLTDNLLWRWYTSLDTFLLARWTGTSLLGYYSLAQQVAELPLEKISTVVNDVSLPAYASLATDRPAAARLLVETLRSHATVGFPAFWGLAAVAPALVPVLFGPRWERAVFPLIALAAIAPLRLIGSIETPAMTGLGRPDILVRTKLLIAPVMTVALAVGCWAGGIDGAALAWLSVFPAVYALAFRYVLHTAGVPYVRMLQVIRGPAVAAGGMAVAVVASYDLAARWQLNDLAILAGAIVAGAGVYALALRMIDPDAYRLAQARLGRFLGLGQPA